jgi:hypothetical protein
MLTNLQPTTAPEPNPALVCPECGGDVEMVLDGMIGERVIPGYHYVGDELPTRWRLAPFGACTRCEFCIEVKIAR